MKKQENDIRTISKKMILLDYLQVILFVLAFSNMFYWGFVGAYYSNLTLIFSMFCLLGLIAASEYAFNTNQISTFIKKIRLSFAFLFVMVIAFFQYAGLMTFYIPNYKAEVYTKLFEQFKNQNNWLINNYKQELFRNINYIEPSNNYIHNVTNMYHQEFLFFVIIIFIISIFSVWFIVKFINNNREFIQIFVNSQKEKLLIRSKYKEREYEEKIKNETIIKSIKNLTNNFHYEEK